MAQVLEENIVIKVSKLVRNSDGTTELISSESLAALEQVAQELLGPDVIVEVEKA
jgi:hypothetical protein